jgi:hypothetical protein
MSGGEIVKGGFLRVDCEVMVKGGIFEKLRCGG